MAEDTFMASGLEDLGFSMIFPRNLDRQRSLMPIPYSKKADIRLLNGINSKPERVSNESRRRDHLGGIREPSGEARKQKQNKETHSTGLVRWLR